jgi:DNA-binding transcriptional LysR family regulator
MPIRFTLRQLEYFVAVGEAGSIALAAERINVSSPSISAAIAQLEHEFGLQLFLRRHAQGLSLTQGGRQFVAEARAVLGAANRLNDLANDITGKVRGRLSVGCLVTFAQMVVPRVRRSFVDRFPEVEFRQYELDQAEIFAGLRAARLDVALTYELDIPPDLTFQPLLSLAPHAVLHEGHPLADRAHVTPAELAPLPMVLLDLPFSTNYFMDLFRPTGLRPNVVERTRDLGVMRSMVANGFGYSIANIRPATATAPDGGPLRFVPLRGPAPLALGLVLAEGARASLTIRAFIDHCSAEVTEATLPGLIIGGAGVDPAP